MKILIAEDNKAFSDQLSAFLRECDYTVVVAESASGLRSRVKRDSRIDLVVLDLLLGQEESIEGAIGNIETIRACWPFVPILVFTEHAQKEWIPQVKNAGANDVLRKPPKITRDFFTSVFLPVIKEMTHRHGDFDFGGITGVLRSLSEDALIKRVVVPLFTHMGYSEVAAVEHHGPGEYGMDILPFHKVGDLGERVYCAAQVKAGDIHAKAGGQDMCVP